MVSSLSLLAKPKKGELPPSDVEKGSTDEVGLQIAQSLRCKGYCAITGGIAEEAIAEACRDVATLDAEGRLRQPASLIQEGLLGVDGSTRIAELEKTDFSEDCKAMDGVGLRDVDLVMWMIAKAIEPHQETMGIRCTSRSLAYVHQAGSPDEEVELTDHEASKWVSLFVRQKIILLVFLGPENGTLSLRPYEEDANPVEFATAPGLMVLVRSDQLAYRFYTKGNVASNVVSSFFLQDDILRMHRNLREQHMVPAATELENWINARLKQLKDGEEEDTVWDESIPRHFVLAMNHHFYKRQQVAVRGVCGRYPASWESENWFLALVNGPDLVTDIPLMRWDHSTIYDPDPDAWQSDAPKTTCKHAAFMEGVDLFDNKMFGLSVSEVRGMDPSQRQVLEVAYDSLFRSGMKKSTLMNSTCGMYVGTSMSEWNYAERTADVGIFGATGGAPSITAGRISFCLGLKGASLAIDTEAASSLTAVYWAAESVQKKGRAPVQELACAIGVHLILAKVWWPAHTGAGFLSPAGRCLTFDAKGSGYVRGEGCAAAVVRSLKEQLDGDVVVDDGQPLEGLVSGGASNNNGRNASLSAPHGPAEQQVLVEACRKAGITPLDVDAVETHGAGSLLGDAVEASSCGHALRSGNQNEPLLLTSTKTVMGNGIEVAGTVSFLKVLHSIKWGFQPSNLHLRQLNPHLEFEEFPLLMSTECVEYRMRSSFCGVSARGFGGTNVHVLCYGNMNEDLRPPPQASSEDRQPRLAFWPAGGGSLEGTSRPKAGYSIVGTWSDWRSPEAMEDEGDGTYGVNVTLGENRWEQFHILLDGDARKVLHPQQYAAPKGTVVFGPSAASQVKDSTWLIDTRTELVDKAAGVAAAASKEGAGAVAAAAPELIVYGEDRGSPGDIFRVRIHAVGKFRTVTWSFASSGGEGAAAAVPRGRYYIVASWNGWQFEEMDPDPAEPGLFQSKVKLTGTSAEFHIARNMDLHQTLFPASARATAEAAVRGPQDRVQAFNWCITGKAGQSFRIVFQRTEDQGQDIRKITWTQM